MSSDDSQKNQLRRFAVIFLILLGAVLAIFLVPSRRGRGGTPPLAATASPALPADVEISPSSTPRENTGGSLPGTPVPDPAEALQIALEMDAQQPADQQDQQDVVSNDDAARCIWNNAVMQRCSAQQWKRRLLRQVLRDYRLYDNATDEIKRMVTPDPDCEEFFAFGDLRRFATNADGLAERYSWEFSGDSNTRALFLAFLDLFDDSAMVPFKCKKPMQQCENAGRGTIDDEKYYVQQAVFHPRPILLQPKNESKNKKQKTESRRPVPESDLVSVRPMGPGREIPYADGANKFTSGLNDFLLIDKKQIKVDDDNTVMELRRVPPLGRVLDALRGAACPAATVVASRDNKSSSANGRSLLRVFHTHDTTSESLTSRKQHIIASETYSKIAWGPVPPQMWRREALRAFFVKNNSNLSSTDLQQQQQQQPSKLFRDFFSGRKSDVLTNSARPKIVPRSCMHQEVMSIDRSIALAVGGRTRNFSKCSRRYIDFNDCIEMLPAENLGPNKTSRGDLLTPVYFDLRPEEKIQQYLASGRSNEQEMRAATRFGFSNAMEERLVTSSLDYQWRYILRLSTRRNVHLSVFHEIHTIADRAALWYLGSRQFPRESQGGLLRKLLRFEIMRAAGLLSGLDPSSIVDQSLREDQQEEFFVRKTERDIVQVWRRRWNSSDDFRTYANSEDPREAYYARNVRNLLITDVHVAARKYIREELLAKLKSKAALRSMGRLMAHTFFLDAYTGNELRDFCRRELRKRGFSYRESIMCHATKDPMHFERKYMVWSLQNLIASVLELERCRRGII